MSWLCAGPRLTSGRCAPSTTHLHRHPHIPDGLWHKTLAVTLPVYWLGCPGVADQPLGLREALSWCPTPSPSSSCCACGSCGICTEIRAPGTGGGGGFKQNQIRGGGGVGNIRYNEDMPLAIHNRVHGDGQLGRVLTHRAGPPERNGHFKCLRASSGSLPLAPHSQGWG